jgi:uncharacterized membrane protein
MAPLTTLFDPRTVLLAKHAQHVVLVHFPIALTMTAIGFEWVAAWRPGTFGLALAEAAYWNLTAAAATALAAVATGFAAWQWELDGAPLSGTLRLHAVFGGASAGAIVLLWWIRARRRRQAATAPGLFYFGLTVLVFAIVAATGHLGGFVSGVNGVVVDP